MDKVELDLVFLIVLQFFPFSIIPPVVHARLFMLPIDRIIK